MKVMIEINLPDGQKIPTSEDILRLTSPDWIASWWHIDDCRGFLEANDLSEDECREVLRRAKQGFDANDGINWATIEYLINVVESERKEVIA